MLISQAGVAKAEGQYFFRQLEVASALMLEAVSRGRTCRFHIRRYPALHIKYGVSDPLRSQLRRSRRPPHEGDNVLDSATALKRLAGLENEK